MQMTVEFTDVYDGDEKTRVRDIDVPAPATGADMDDWAYDNLFPHTGDGDHPSGNAGYFADVKACKDRPELVGREFTWGL